MTKILLVDDDLVVLATVAMGLSRAGYAVLQADNGLDAIELAKAERPDFAVLDMRMPGLTGLAVAQVFQNEFKLPYLFLSAFNDDEIVQQAAQLGAMGYLVKPIEVQQIIPAIEVALVRSDNMFHLAQDNANLATALSANREIDVALGLVMGRFGLDRATAFAKMRAYARSHRTKMLVVAQRLIAGEAITLDL